MAGGVSWSGQNDPVYFNFGEGEHDVSSIEVYDPDATVEWEEENYVHWISVSGHSDNYYDGVYLRSDDWNGYAHFERPDGSAHLYWLDSGSGYWQFDYREQDGTQDYYDGGYLSSGPQLDAILGDVDFSSGVVNIEHGYEEYNCDDGGCGPNDNLNMYIKVSGHDNEFYNGNYWSSDNWNGAPHFMKEDGSAHLYFLNSGGGYW